MRRGQLKNWKPFQSQRFQFPLSFTFTFQNSRTEVKSKSKDKQIPVEPTPFLGRKTWKLKVTREDQERTCFSFPRIPIVERTESFFLDFLGPFYLFFRRVHHVGVKSMEKVANLKETKIVTYTLRRMSHLFILYVNFIKQRSCYMFLNGVTCGIRSTPFTRHEQLCLVWVNSAYYGFWGLYFIWLIHTLKYTFRTSRHILTTTTEMTSLTTTTSTQKYDKKLILCMYFRHDT